MNIFFFFSLHDFQFLIFYSKCWIVHSNRFIQESLAISGEKSEQNHSFMLHQVGNNL
jgi:hypothetical protein